ncbi:DUF935 domain-containing protein [Pasteurella multocida]
MKFLDKLKGLINVKTEPTQTHEAMVTERGRIISDHPSNKITPEKLKTILEDAERGDITAQHELFMDIEERDNDIAAHVQTRKRAILKLDWHISAPRNATAAEEKLQAEIEELFYQYPNFEDLLVDMMDAVGHGFSALEIEWKLEQGKHIPHKFIPRPQSWFCLDKDDNLLLKTPENVMGEPLWLFGWVVHKHKSRTVQLARMGLFRTLVWLYMFKYYSVFDFAEFLELYGMPIRIGKYGYGASEGEKKTLLRALAQIGHNAAGIMPEGMSIELHNAANSTSANNPFLQMIEWCEKSAARLILGQTLTSGADGKSSTNALGQVHNEVRMDLLVSDAKQVAQTITQQIILPYLQINVDPNISASRVPYFEFDTKEYEDLSTFAEAIPKLVAVGVQVPERWARDKLGIPEAQKDEIILGMSSSDVKSHALSAHVVGCQCTACLHGKPVSLSAKNKAFDEQVFLDDSVDEALGTVDFNTQLDPVVRQLVGVLVTCSSYEEASDKLAEIYPDLDTSAHQRYLTQAVFLSEILGASNVRR